MTSREENRPSDGQPAPPPSIPLLAAAAASPRRLFLALFVCLLLANSLTLTNPPYWDAILGPLAEALWLKDHHFDYVRLWTNEPGYLNGGAAVYLVSIVPTVYAGLLLALPTSLLFLLLHLLAIAFSAYVFTVFYRLAHQAAGAPAAFLWCLAALVDPIWSGQTAAINLEMPMVAACAASLLALHRGREGQTAAFAVLAMAIKPTAIVFCLALGGFAGIRFLLQVTDRQTRVAAACRSLAVLAVPLAYAALGWLAYRRDLANFRYPHLGVVIRRFLASLPVLAPSLALLFALTAAVVVARLVPKRTAIRRSFLDPANAAAIVTALSVAGFWGSQLINRNALARYFTFTVFPLTLLAALALPRRWKAPLAVLWVAIGLANQYGAFYPAVHTRSGHILERSREYLRDLRSNQVVCRQLEARFADRVVVAKWPFAQMLTRPEFGYVRHGLPLVLTGPPAAPTYARAWSFNPNGVLPLDVVVVFADNVFENSYPPPLKPPADATILLRDDGVPDSPLYVWTPQPSR